MACDHIPSPNPRMAGSCVKCGRAIPGRRPRDVKLERMLTQLAAQSGGSVGPMADYGLTDLAESRAWPGGVRPNIDSVRETKEEYADARNYLLWGIERVYEDFQKGDPQAIDIVTRNMNSLRRLTQAWRELLV